MLIRYPEERMFKAHRLIAVFASRRVFAVTCGLLAIQLLLVCYSYSERARSILWLDGKVKPDAVGVSEARWVLFHMDDAPAQTGEPWRREFLRSGYVIMPGVCFVVVLHMA